MGTASAAREKDLEGWIYFTSQRTGRLEVWKVRAEGGSETQVTTTGAFMAVESVDGKHLYIRRGTSDTGDVYRIRTDGTEEVKVLGGVKGRMFTVFEKGMYCRRLTAAGAALPGFPDGIDPRDRAAQRSSMRTSVRTRRGRWIRNWGNPRP